MPMYTPRYAGNTSTCTGTGTQFLRLTSFQVYARFQNNARALVYAQEIEAAILYARGQYAGFYGVSIGYNVSKNNFKINIFVRICSQETVLGSGV